MAGNKDIVISVKLGSWSIWCPIQSYIGKHKYTVSYSFRDSPMEMPFEVQIKYMDRAKTSVVTTLGPGSHIVEGDGAGSDYIRLRSLSFGFGSVAVTVPN